VNLPGWLKKRIVTNELDKIEKEQPMIRKVLDWLTDPNVPGRKRSIAAWCVVLGMALRGADQGIQNACEAALFLAGSAVCSLHPATWAAFVDGASAVIQSLEHGMDFAAVAFAAIGILHARQKAAVTLPPGYYTKADLDSAIAGARRS